MIKLKSLLKEGKVGSIFNMKKEMEDGSFEPDNPSGKEPKETTIWKPDAPDLTSETFQEHYVHENENSKIIGTPHIGEEGATEFIEKKVGVIFFCLFNFS